MINFFTHLTHSSATPPAYQRQTVTDSFFQNDGVILSSNQVWEVPLAPDRASPGRGTSVQTDLGPRTQLESNVTLKSGVSIKADCLAHKLTISRENPGGVPTVLAEIDNASMAIPKKGDGGHDIQLQVAGVQSESIDARSGVIQVSDDANAHRHLSPMATVYPDGHIYGVVFDRSGGHGIPVDERPDGSLELHIHRPEQDDFQLLVHPMLSRQEVGSPS